MVKFSTSPKVAHSAWKPSVRPLISMCWVLLVLALSLWSHEGIGVHSFTSVGTSSFTRIAALRDTSPLPSLSTLVKKESSSPSFGPPLTTRARSRLLSCSPTNGATTTRATASSSSTASIGMTNGQARDISSSFSQEEARTLAIGKDKRKKNPSKLQSVTQNAKLFLLTASKLKKPKSLQSKETFLTSTTAGLAVALTMIPEAVAFSFVAGVNPIVGLWTTVTLGFVAASLTGRAGILSSASGACSVVVASLCRSMGPQQGPVYLAATAIVAGLFQLVGGALGIGKFIRLVPHPVMLGFVNGLAIIMTRAQLHHLQGLSLATTAGQATYGIVALTMALVKLLPRFKFYPKVIPSTLGAVTIASLLANLWKLPVTTLADVAGASTFSGGWSVLPTLALPSIPWTSLATWKLIAPVAFTVAAVGAIESLLTMQILDGIMDDGKRGSTRKEMVAQGVGNVVSGLCGGFGGCALLGLSIINVESGGGLSKWSGMSCALFLALGIVAAAPLLAAVPVSSLIGVMLLVCYGTFSWSSLRLLNKIPKLDAFVIGLVSLITVQRDLAQAVVAGTIASALGFAWKQSTNLLATATTRTGSDCSPQEKIYQLNGPLFFGSTIQFASLFDAKSDPSKVILDFTNCRVWDHSALEAIQSLSNQYEEQGKQLYLRHLSSDGLQLLSKLNKKRKASYQVESDPESDPVYGVAETEESYSNLAVA